VQVIPLKIPPFGASIPLKIPPFGASYGIMHGNKTDLKGFCYV
jgi:hypothetical protein